MRYLTAILITLLLAVPAMSVEVFRYQGAGKDGGTLEYIFKGSSLRLLWQEGLVRNSEHFLRLWRHPERNAGPELRSRAKK
jgi:hypothetical protein